MNTNLNKYLYEVFRKEVKDTPPLSAKPKQFQHQFSSVEQRKSYFLIDNQYASKLDEII